MRYPALELGQAGREKCPNAYNEASTLICPGATRLILQISKANLMVQMGVMPQGKGIGSGAVVWLNEEPYLPISAVLGRKFDAVRVRNWAAGAEAEVFLIAA
jgi:hypothetical protein